MTVNQGRNPAKQIEPYAVTVCQPHNKTNTQCMLYGGTAEQFRFIRQQESFYSGATETILSEALKGVPEGEAQLLCALGHSAPDTRVSYSKELMKALWRADTGLGPYPLLELLADYERTKGVYYINYRDHIMHQVRVWILGLYLIGKWEFLRNALIDEAVRNGSLQASDRPQRLAHALRCWKIAALWHDIGYIFEALNPKAPDTLMQKPNEALKACFTNPLADVLQSQKHALTQLDEESLISIADSYGCNLPELKSIRIFDTLFTAGHVERWKHLEAAGLHAGLGKSQQNDGGFKQYLELCRARAFTEKWSQRPAFIDHGIGSAFLLLHLQEYMTHYTTKMLEFLAHHPEVIDKEKIDLVTDYAARLKNTLPAIHAAMGAIALHNIMPSLIEPVTAQTNGLTLTDYRLYLRNDAPRPAVPLAYLLILADVLQDWDRPMLRVPDNPKELTLTDQELIVTASDKHLYIEYLPDTLLPQNGRPIADLNHSKPKIEKLIKMHDELAAVLDGIRPLLKEGITPNLTPDLITAAPQPQQIAIATNYDLAPYLNAVLSECGEITLRGIMSASKTLTAQTIPIQDIYAPLRVKSDRTDQDLWRCMSGTGVEEERISGDVTGAPGADETMRLTEFDEETDDAMPESSLSHNKRKAAQHTSGLFLEGKPGSGKSTFLRMTASVLARALLDDQEALSEAAAKLLRDKSGNLLIPVFVKLSTFTNFIQQQKANLALSEGSAQWLKKYIYNRILGCIGGFPESVVDQWLKEGRLLFLLDGLDEIPRKELRQEVWSILVNAFKEQTYGKCRICITSRPLPEESSPLPLVTETLSGLSREAIEIFLQKWSAHVNRDLGDKRLSPEEYAESLLSQTEKSPEAVQDMLSNPLMLTCLALIFWNNGKLPEQRGELYKTVIDWLIQFRKTFSDTGPKLETCEVETLYKELAIRMQNDPRGRQTKLPLNEAAAAIAGMFSGYATGKQSMACAFLRTDTISSGIITLSEKNMSDCKAEEEISFWHLTFQEYFAAKLLSDLVPKTLYEEYLTKDHLYHPEWKEVVLLLANLMGNSERTDNLIKNVLDTNSNDFLETARAYVLAKAIISDLKTVKYKLPDSLDFHRIEQAALAIFSDKGLSVPVKLRAAVAVEIGRVGDQRLTRDNWVRIPDEAFSGIEKPLVGFWMHAYQVTVQDFAAFVDAGGYKQGGFIEAIRDEWQDACIKARTNENYKRWIPIDDWKRTKPLHWEKQLQSPNCPVIYVTWFEATAYCSWLTASKKDGFIYQLPTDDEWEIAAMGKTRNEPYPWGEKISDEDTAQRANLYETGFREVCPVGLFPNGVADWGANGKLYDMIGNVWEWCLDEEIIEDACPARSVRGGGWVNDAGWIDVRYRDRNRSANRDDDLGFRVARVSAPAQVGSRELAVGGSPEGVSPSGRRPEQKKGKI